MRAPSRLWYDAGWPVVAGATAGVGLLAAYHWSGALPATIALLVLAFTIAPILWCVLAEFGHSTRGVVVRVAPAVAVSVVAMTGLGDAAGSWAFLVGASVLVTSPLLRGWTRRGFVESLAERLSPRTRTRRRFDEIVAGFEPLDDDLLG